MPTGVRGRFQPSRVRVALRRVGRWTAAAIVAAWLAPGNRVEVLLNGDETYPRLWEDLRSARHSITLQLYYGAPGSQREPRRSP